MTLEELQNNLQECEGINSDQINFLKKIFEENNYKNALIIGFDNIKTLCYVSYFIKENGNGHVTAIDLDKYEKKCAIDYLKQVNLEENVSLCYEKNSINEKLMKMIDEENQPQFDFCFIDCESDWNYKYFSFFMIDKLLKPGSVIIFNSANNKQDLNEIPSVKKIYDNFVKSNASYEKFEENELNMKIAYKCDLIQKQDESPILADIDQFATLNNRIDNLTSKIEDYETILKRHGKSIRKLNKFQLRTNKYINSHHELLSTLYLDYKLQPKQLMDDIQILCIELLIFVDKVCRKYGLTWWLDYGVLLGAVRHNYFVPWDDDIDIGMMREDYHKFIEVFPYELEQYGLEDDIQINFRGRNKCKTKVNSFIQLLIRHKIKRGVTTFAGLDIFPYDYMTENDMDEDSFGKLYEKTKKEFYQELAKGSDLYSVYMGINQEELMEKYYSNLNLTFDKAPYIIPGVEGAFGYHINVYELNVFKTEEIFPLRTVQFADYNFPCPRDYKNYLKNIYGNYMAIPKALRLHGRIKKFRYEDNVDLIFQKDIDKLKQVNKKFKVNNVNNLLSKINKKVNF